MKIKYIVPTMEVVVINMTTATLAQSNIPYGDPTNDTEPRESRMRDFTDPYDEDY